MADGSFGKTGSGSASKPADPTADIDDDWALDDADDAPADPAPAEAAASSMAGSSTAPSARGSTPAPKKSSTTGKTSRKKARQSTPKSNPSPSKRRSGKPPKSGAASASPKKSSKAPRSSAPSAAPKKSSRPKSGTPSAARKSSGAPESSATKDDEVALPHLTSSLEAHATTSEPSAESNDNTSRSPASLGLATSGTAVDEVKRLDSVSVEAIPSALPVTEEIDSEWPDDEDASSVDLQQPTFPVAARVPEEATHVGAPLTGATTEASTGSIAPSRVLSLEGGAPTHGATSADESATEPPPTRAKAASYPDSRISETSFQRFEAAASALSERGKAFGLGAASEPPARDSHAEDEAAPSGAVAEAADSDATPGTKPGESLAPSQSDSQPPRHTEKKKSPVLAIGLAAAAIIVAGIGLATGQDDAEDVSLERAKNSLKPDPANGKPAAKALALAKTKAMADAKRAATKDDAAEANQALDGDPAAEPHAAAKQAAEEAAAKAAAAAEGESISIKVNIFPADAQIYHKGKLLGRSGAEIELPQGERKLLVLIRDGYWPRKLILDGTEKVINIGLREQPLSTFLPQGTTAAPQPGPTGTTPTADAPKAAPEASTPTSAPQKKPPAATAPAPVPAAP